MTPPETLTVHWPIAPHEQHLSTAAITAQALTPWRAFLDQLELRPMHWPTLHRCDTSLRIHAQVKDYPEGEDRD